MQLEVKKHLEDIRLAAEKILRFSKGIDRAAFLKNELLQSGVERQFEIIGEAVNRLTRTDPSIAEQLPDRRRVVSFRNILAHGYDIVDPNVVWDVVEDGLPNLLSVVRRLLAIQENLWRDSV